MFTLWSQAVKTSTPNARLVDEKVVPSKLEGFKNTFEIPAQPDKVTCIHGNKLCALAAKDLKTTLAMLRNSDSYLMFELAVYMWELGWDYGSWDGIMRVEEML